MVVLIVVLIVLVIYCFSLKKQIKSLKKQLDFLKDELNYTKNEIKRNKKQIALLENRELKTKTVTINSKKRLKNNIYKGKRALVGDYQIDMLNHTVNVLKSFGILVDVVSSGNDIVEKIKHGYKCDIIFTNNYYEFGFSGLKTLRELKKLPGFNIPVVIHTVSSQKRAYFIDYCGFDEYVLKPLNQDKIKPILDKFLK